MQPYMPPSLQRRYTQHCTRSKLTAAQRDVGTRMTATICRTIEKLRQCSYVLVTQRKGNIAVSYGSWHIVI